MGAKTHVKLHCNPTTSCMDLKQTDGGPFSKGFVNFLPSLRVYSNVALSPYFSRAFTLEKRERERERERERDRER